MQDPGCVGSVVVAHRLSCPTACGILVLRPGIEPASPALEGVFFTTGPPGKSQNAKHFKKEWAYRSWRKATTMIAIWICKLPMTYKPKMILILFNQGHLISYQTYFFPNMLHPHRSFCSSNKLSKRPRSCYSTCLSYPHVDICLSISFSAFTYQFKCYILRKPFSVHFINSILQTISGPLLYYCVLTTYH